MNELTIMNVAELTNASFRKDCTSIAKAVDSKNKSNFKIAKAINHIITSENWQDDFASEEEMATYLGMSKSQMSMLKRADDIKALIGQDNIILDNLTVTKLYEFNPIYRMIYHKDISKEDLELTFNTVVHDFLNTFKSDNEILELNQKDLRNAIKTWIELNFSKEESNDTETDNDNEIETNNDNETVKDNRTEGEVPEITITFKDGNTFEIGDDVTFLLDLTKLLKKYKYI